MVKLDFDVPARGRVPPVGPGSPSPGGHRGRKSLSGKGLALLPGARTVFNWGAGLDPSTRRRDANVHLFGTGKWNRVLIDATKNLDYEPDEHGNRWPPSVRPSDEDIERVQSILDEIIVRANR